MLVPNKKKIPAHNPHFYYVFTALVQLFSYRCLFQPKPRLGLYSAHGANKSHPKHSEGVMQEKALLLFFITYAPAHEEPVAIP